VISKTSLALNLRRKAINGSRVLVLGIAYKKNVDDMRESPSVALMEKLRDLGADVSYSDPHIPVFPKMREHRFDLKSVALNRKSIASYDCVLVATDHSRFDYDLIGKHGYDWRLVFAAFEATRAPNTRAIAEMALENYLEMRDEVRDAKFELRTALSFELERRFPGHWVPRYSMVMFHPEIPYAEAQRRGGLQSGILQELTTHAGSLPDVNFARAAELVSTLLG
jgi:hypothetical protein